MEISNIPSNSLNRCFSLYRIIRVEPSRWREKSSGGTGTLVKRTRSRTHSILLSIQSTIAFETGSKLHSANDGACKRALFYFGVVLLFHLSSMKRTKKHHKRGLNTPQRQFRTNVVVLCKLSTSQYSRHSDRETQLMAGILWTSKRFSHSTWRRYSNTTWTPRHLIRNFRQRTS